MKLSWKPFVKVPLVLAENLVFGTFPSLRPWVERYLFNPYDFNEAHIEYSKRKFDEFFVALPADISLANKTVLELGPGGSVGFGLLALQAGAAQYLALDDGEHTFVRPRQIRGYRKLVGNDTVLRCFEKRAGRIVYREEAIRFKNITQASGYPLPDASVDVIYSCAVLEHVHDLDQAFSEMSRVLKPGGIMYHEVDLRDHIFSQDSLWFLSIPDRLFRFFFRHTGGYVNRARFSAYRALAGRFGLETLAWTPTIRFVGIPPRGLMERFSEEDLRTLSFVMVIRKAYAHP